MDPGKKVEEICQLLNESTDGNCMEWMQRAVEHCGQIMTDPKTHDSNFWKKMRSAFGSDGNKDEIISAIKVGNDVSPEELTLSDCGNLFKTITDDYFKRWPYFPYTDIMFIETIFYGLMVAGIFTVFVYAYLHMTNKRKQPVCKSILEQHSNNLTTGINQSSRHSLNTNESSESEFGNENASKTIIVKVNRANEGIEYDDVPLENGYRQYEITDSGQEMPYQRATLERILDFIEDYAKEMRVVVLIDDDKVYQEMFNPALKNHQEKYEESLHLKCERSKSEISTTSSGTIRSRIPVSNLRKTF